MGFSIYSLFNRTGLFIIHDEVAYFYESLRLFESGRLPVSGHGPLFSEVVALLHGVLFAVYWAFGWVDGSVSYLAELLSHEARYLAWFRFFNGVMTLLLVYQVYRVGRLLGGPLAGAISALFCATNLSVHLLTSLLKADTLYWLFVFLCLELAWNTAQKRTTRAACLTGLVMGLSMSTKYMALPVVLLLTLPFITGPKNEWKKSFKLSTVMAISALGVMALLFPPLLLSFDELLAWLSHTNVEYSQNKGGIVLWDYLLIHLPDLVGWPLVLFAAIEAGRRLVREPKGPILLGMVGVGLLIAVGCRSGMAIAYYILPFGMFVAILGATFLARLIEGDHPLSIRLGAVAIIILVAFFSAPFFEGTLKYRLLIAGDDTRLISRDYLESQAKPDDKILITLGISGYNHFGPKLKSDEPPFGKGKFRQALERAAVNNHRQAYPLTIVSRVPNWDRVTASKFDWIAIPDEFGHPWDLGWDGTARPYVPPPGFKLVKTVEPFPRPTTGFYPNLMAQGYERFRKNSIQKFAQDAVLGPPIRIYKRIDKAS